MIRTFLTRHKCAYIVILQFVLIVAASANTLLMNEEGDVLAETDRYVARFEHGVLTDFHNKLTRETYTQGESEALTRLKVGRSLTTNDITPEIKKKSHRSNANSSIRIAGVFRITMR